MFHKHMIFNFEYYVYKFGLIIVLKNEELSNIFYIYINMIDEILQ